MSLDADLYPPFENAARACPRCGWVALRRGGLCPICREFYLGTLVNRAFGDLIHAASAARRQDRQAAAA